MDHQKQPNTGVSKPFLLDVNPYLLQEYAETFELTLSDAYDEYIKTFNKIRVMEKFTHLKDFHIQTQIQPALLEVVSEIYGPCGACSQNQGVLNRSFEKIPISVLQTVRLCAPPINFVDYYGCVTTIGNHYKKILSLLLSGNIQAAQKHLEELTNVNYYASLSVKAISGDTTSSGDSCANLIQSHNSLSASEHYLIMLAWLNKHFSLMPDRTIKQARFWFSVLLFKLIKDMVFDSEFLNDNDEIEGLLREKQMLNREISKIKRRSKKDGKAALLKEKRDLVKHINRQIREKKSLFCEKTISDAIAVLKSDSD